MATRFATATGNWSNTAIWDGGTLPTSADTVHPNGFTVTIDQDVTIDGFNNNISPVYLPGMSIPKMTGNTQPSGTANSSGNAVGFLPYLAFDQNSAGTSAWVSNVNNTGWVSYDYGTNKLIKRYYIKWVSTNSTVYPITWNFEGWNGASWDILEAKSAQGTAVSTGYVSALLTHTTQYSLYRINVLASSATNSPPSIGIFEMTESTGSTYGLSSAGSFTVPSSLVGTRNIQFNGAGIVSNSSNTVVTTAHTSGNTVNFNVTSGGYILNQNYQTGDRDLAVISINGTGTLNFNGDIWGSQTLAYNRTGAFYINANATVNIYGNVYAPKGGAAAQTYFIVLAGTVSNSAVLNITGNVGASGTYSNVWTIYSISNATTTITGTLTSDLGVCYYSAAGSILNIPTGTVTVTNLNSNPAIVMIANTSLLTINGPIINKVNVNAVCAAKIRFYSIANPYWVFQTTTGTNITLASPGAINSYPSGSDVRVGVYYGIGGVLTGSCYVPLPQYVSQGVLVDNTTGSAQLTAADFLSAISSSSDPLAIRLRNVATVDTVGGQIAAFTP